MRRIPSLDGLRAISICCVFLGHLFQATLNPSGRFGVKVFFVISGFLITTLLLQEKSLSGKIDLKAFYTRRVLRIFPAAYFYLLVVAGLSFLGLVQLLPHDLAFGFTYLMSYHDTASASAVVHLWSLSVEEQFYLLWPPIVLLLRDRARTLAGVVVLAMPFLRAALWLTGHRAALQHLMAGGVDAIALGCWAAWGKWKPQRFPWMWLLIGFAITLVQPEFLPLFYRRGLRLVQDSAVHLLILACMLGSIGASGWWGKLLNWRPVTFIGVLSYSLYLWQQLFLLNDYPPSLRIAESLLAACVSYYLIERPFLGLKERFQSSGKSRAVSA